MIILDMAPTRNQFRVQIGVGTSRLLSLRLKGLVLDVRCVVV